jgi:hypothetical protein
MSLFAKAPQQFTLQATITAVDEIAAQRKLTAALRIAAQFSPTELEAAATKLENAATRALLKPYLR